MHTGLEVKQYNHYVYIMRSNPSGYIKIGRSINVKNRSRMLSFQTFSDMEVLYKFGYNASEDCAMVEKYFHVAYAKYASDMHLRTTEWFKPEVIDHLPKGRIDPEACKMWLIRYYPGFVKRFRKVWADHDEKWHWIPVRPYK